MELRYKILTSTMYVVVYIWIAFYGLLFLEISGYKGFIIDKINDLFYIIFKLIKGA